MKFRQCNDTNGIRICVPRIRRNHQIKLSHILILREQDLRTSHRRNLYLCSSRSKYEFCNINFSAPCSHQSLHDETQSFSRLMDNRCKQTSIPRVATGQLHFGSMPNHKKREVRILKSRFYRHRSRINEYSSG